MADVGIHVVEDMSKEANPSSINAADDEIHETSTAGEDQGSRRRSFLRKTAQVSFKVIIVLAFIIASPITIVIGPVLLSLFAEIMVWSLKGRPKAKGIYEKVFSFESLSEKIQRLSMVSIARLGCLAFTLLAITLRVSSLKSETVLGSPLWKWSLFAAVVFYGYPCAQFAFTSASITASFIFDPLEAHDKAYFWLGLLTSVSLLLYSTSVLIIWLSYFHTDRGLKQNRETLYKYVTWTLVSFLVGAILGLMKAVVVLHWRAKAIYRRFKPRILMAGFQLYFLCIIVGKFASLSLMPWRYQILFFDELPKLIEDEREPHRTADKKRRSIQDYFLTTHASSQQLSGITGRLASLAQVLREDDGVAEVEQKCRDRISNKGDEQSYITKEYIVGLFQELYDDVAETEARSSDHARVLVDNIYFFETIFQWCRMGDEDQKQRQLKRIAEKKETMKKRLSVGRYGTPKNKTLGDHVSIKCMNDGADLLLEELKAQQSSDMITHEMLRKWMVDAHKECLSLGYTLVDAMAVVNVLDWVLTWSIVAVVILFWLIATGLATTAVLVTIVSPFVALTFMFGDTFKAFFQGVIFSFATHPFDVGDECSIDGEELVVKNINILTTTFYGNKNKDIVLLPNSDLGTKRIAVHKSGSRSRTTTTKDASTQADDSPDFDAQTRLSL